MSHHKKHKTHEEEQLDELLLRAQQNDPTEESSAVADNEDENEENEENEERNEKSGGKRGFINQLLNSEGEGGPTSVREVIRSFNINGEWFRHNIRFIIITVICLLLFVTNRYQAQQEMIEEARLKNELAEMRYKWLTRFSELTTSMRQSQIERQLKQNGDTALTHSRQAPFIIWVDEQSPHYK